MTVKYLTEGWQECVHTLMKAKDKTRREQVHFARKPSKVSKFKMVSLDARKASMDSRRV